MMRVGALALGLALALVLLAGCAQRPATPSVPHASSPDVANARDPRQCTEFLHRLDALVARRGVQDALAHRVAGYPYLRISRTLSALRSSRTDRARFERELAAMMRLDRTARGFELANLDGIDTVQRERLLENVRRCGDTLLARDLESAATRAALADALEVPDSYSTASRALGLYPLTALGFLAGVDHLHRSFRQTFAMPRVDLPVHGALWRYLPPRVGVAAVAHAPTATPTRGLSDPFSTVAMDDPRLEQLFARHAPIIEVDVVSDDDRIGMPTLDAEHGARIDTTDPVVLKRVSHALVGGEVRLQLNYLFWFPARPAAGAFDVLAGRLDGIIWRVTLDRDGQALIYDSVHLCGCYHVFVPGERVNARPARARFEEPVLVVQRAPAGDGRIVLRIAHRTHYLERVYRLDAERSGSMTTRHYRMDDDDALRSLALADGRRRSLFASDGLVHGSERPERWLFWPMGVASAGAMRQWGHHAVAFVGRRHFDDPLLLDRHFEFVDTSRAATR